MEKDTGGPAFPGWYETEEEKISGGIAPEKYIEVDDKYSAGMTLRDYFAGQALIGWLSTGDNNLSNEGVASTAEVCYQYADAMLKERNRKEQ